MVLTEGAVDEILDYRDKAIENTVKEMFGNMEINTGLTDISNFLQNQFDIRLENILLAKNSSTHHLESGMKNKIIQRKRLLTDKIDKQYKN